MRNKLIISVIILSSIIGFAVLYPRFVFKKNSCVKELNRIGIASLLDSVNIVDFSYRSPRTIGSLLYAKLVLTVDEFERVKEEMLAMEDTLSSKDYSAEVNSKQVKLHYDTDRFASSLNSIRNLAKRNDLHTFSLDNYEELMIASVLTMKTTFLIGIGTTGEAFYILVKELDGSCHLYIASI